MSDQAIKERKMGQFWARTQSEKEEKPFIDFSFLPIEHYMTGIKEFDTYAMIEAAKNGKIEEVRSLCEKGVSVNVQDRDGATALHMSCFYGLYSTAECLINERKADVSVVDKMKETALHKAVQYDNTDIVEILCESGAEVKFGNKYGFTPLHYASAYGHVLSVATLLEFGADNFMMDHSGRTAKDVAGELCWENEEMKND